MSGFKPMTADEAHDLLFGNYPKARIAHDYGYGEEMTNANKVRRAHKLLDELDVRAELPQEQEKLLRSFLPNLPKQKTLEGIATDVYIAWNETYGSDWEEDTFGDLEVWLGELYEHLRSLADAEPAKPARPEFLETEADYQNAPEGTIVALDGSGVIWLKKFGGWRNTAGDHGVESACIALDSRRVLRWGNE